MEQPEWPTDIQRVWSTERVCGPALELELLQAPQLEPAPAVIASLLSCPVHELKQRLAVAGVSSLGVVEKLDLVHLVAVVETTALVNEGLPPNG